MTLGFPVALKALGVAHKSEVGAVRLNLKRAEVAVQRRPRTICCRSAPASMSSAWCRAASPN